MIAAWMEKDQAFDSGDRACFLCDSGWTQKNVAAREDPAMSDIYRRHAVFVSLRRGARSLLMTAETISESRPNRRR
jgi:hypothetical protein